MINCAHPIVILHPYFKNNFLKYRCAVVNGQIVDFRKHTSDYCNRHWNQIYKQYFSLPKVAPDPNNLDVFYIPTDPHSLPIYLAVPCGQCALCRQRKINELSSRCRLETYSSPYKPLFITLTYDNDHLPENGVSVKDTQDFLKRLRINLNRSFGHHVSLRYIISSEYGKHTHRPHYHMILWNMPYFKSADSNVPCTLCTQLGKSPNVSYLNGLKALTDFVRKSWKNGFVSVQVSKDPSSKYLLKYIGKGSDVPFGKNPCFCHWSRRPALGRVSFDLLHDQLSLGNVTSLKFFDPKVGSLQTIKIPRYYMSLMCPSPSVVISKIRSKLDEFRYLHFAIEHHFFNEDFQLLDSRVMFKDICYRFFPFVATCSLNIDPYYSDKFSYFDFCKTVDWREDYAYWQFFALYNDLLNYLPHLDHYIYDQLPWKEKIIFILQEESCSDKRSLSDKLYAANSNFNKLCQKSLL